MTHQHVIRIDESQRQIILMALAHLAVERPGWMYACGETAITMDNVRDGLPAMFSEFHALRVQALGQTEKNSKPKSRKA